MPFILSRPAHGSNCAVNTPPGTEANDIVYVIDGSGSMDTIFSLQREGIYATICGPSAFVPADGTAAIAIVQFSNYNQPQVEIPLILLTPDNLSSVCQCISNILPQQGETVLAPGLAKAHELLGTGNPTANRFVVLSSDGEVYDVSESNTRARELRTDANPATICAVMANELLQCDPPRQPGTGNLIEWSNSDGRYPTEPIGGFGCATSSAAYSRLVDLCLCTILNASKPDCDNDGVPDPCEVDCNHNGIPDDCEDGTPDLNCNGQRDECEGVLYVDWQSPGPTHDGSSWNSAYLTIQDALAAAAASGTKPLIYVAQGIYKPALPGSGDRLASFALVDGVGLYGGFAGSSTGSPNDHKPGVYKTILSGDIEGNDPLSTADNVYHVITSTSTNDARTQLDGFFIMAGVADGVSGEEMNGAGMLNSNGHGRISNCVFLHNVANGQGGGLWSNGGLEVVGCVLSGNEALTGGGMYSGSSAGIVVNCTVYGNIAVGNYGGICAFNSTISNCLLWGNQDSSGTGETAQLSGATATSLKYSIVQGWTGAFNGIYNNGDNPLFVNPAGPDGIVGTLDDNLLVKTHSPAIDSGDNTAIAGRACLDPTGGPRFLDDPAAAKTGKGTPPIVDRGAYEYNVAGGDCNGNGIPDALDIANHTSNDCDNTGIPDECKPDCNNDGIPNACSGDDDGDGIPDAVDNCPCVYNPDQADCDGDGIGDACSTSSGVIGDFDHNCSVDLEDFAVLQQCYTGPYQTVSSLFPDGHCDGMDLNHDGYITTYHPSQGAGDPERFGDIELLQNCRSGPGMHANKRCLDCNDNGIADADPADPDPLLHRSATGGVDFDYDGDGVQVKGRLACRGVNTGDCDDNCPCVYNPDQADYDGDGIGDACEEHPPP